jgi:predicted transcriptional regulator
MNEKQVKYMNLNEFSFFNPSPDFREMEILKTINENPETSQEKIALKAGIVPSMTNRYIRDFEESGLLKKVGKTRRNMNYELTDAGKARLGFLSLAFLKEAAKMYTDSYDIFGSLIEILSDRNYKGIYLYGAGIVGGILTEILKLENIKILGFIDDSISKQNEKFHDIQIYSPEIIEGKEYDVIIVASFRHTGEIIQQAKKYKMKNIYIFSLNNGYVSLINYK